MKHLGVHSVVVALIASKAEIVYDPSRVTVEELVDEIDKLGYKASLIHSGSSAQNKILLTVCHSPLS